MMSKIYILMVCLKCGTYLIGKFLLQFAFHISWTKDCRLFLAGNFLQFKSSCLPAYPTFSRPATFLQIKSSNSLHIQRLLVNQSKTISCFVGNQNDLPVRQSNRSATSVKLAEKMAPDAREQTRWVLLCCCVVVEMQVALFPQCLSDVAMPSS